MTVRLWPMSRITGVGWPPNDPRGAVLIIDVPYFFEQWAIDFMSLGWTRSNTPAAGFGFYDHNPAVGDDMKSLFPDASWPSTEKIASSYTQQARFWRPDHANGYGYALAEIDSIYERVTNHTQIQFALDLVLRINSGHPSQPQSIPFDVRYEFYWGSGASSGAVQTITHPVYPAFEAYEYIGGHDVMTEQTLSYNLGPYQNQYLGYGRNTFGSDQWMVRLLFDIDLTTGVLAAPTFA